MTPDLLAEFKANKATVMAELRQPWKPPRRGFDGYEPGALAGTAMARQARGGEEPSPSIGANMARLSERDLDDMTRQQVAAARPVEVPGVSHEFQARLDAEDLADIAAGDIPLETVQAFEAAAIAREAKDLIGILEHDAGLPRAEAELEAARITATYARNRGYLWASAALADYPVLLAQLPDTPGTVDSLPFRTASVHVREGAKPGPASGSIVITEAEIEAARKSRLVVRQGAFTGAQEVKP